MASEFVKVGQTTFPGRRDIRCSRYEWHSLSPRKHGRFNVRFLSPDNEHATRRYWVEPLLRTWTGSRPDRFLERACDYGYKILAELGQHDDDTCAAYHVARLIFRNRHAGHVRVGRQFSCAADFVDFSCATNPRLILPAIGNENLRVRADAETVHGKARSLLRAALRAANTSDDLRTSRIEPIVALYECLVAASTMPATTGGADDCTDDIFVVRTIPNPARFQIESQVRSALIAGPVTDEDFRRVEADEETLRLFLHNLERKAFDGCTQEQFDHWLQRVRNEGYLQLVGGRNLRGPERAQAKEQAQRIFCWLLWQSYRMMAKCYGALMALISADFAINNKGRQPDKVEQFLFDLEHRQVDFLGGLPLAFLEASQLRWIIRTLHKLEACLVQGDFDRYQATWGNRESAFADIPALLGIFGRLSRERRAADRRMKDRNHDAQEVETVQVSGSDVLDNKAIARDVDPAEAAASLEESNRPPQQLHSTQCPKNGCAASLSFSALVDGSDLRRAIVDLFCPRCDDTIRYVIDLTKLQP